jgi:hypothetical protein
MNIFLWQDSYDNLTDMPLKELRTLARKLGLDASHEKVSQRTEASFKDNLIREIQDALDVLVSGPHCDNSDDKTILLDTISTIPAYCRYTVKLTATGNRSWCYDIRDLWDCIVNNISQPPYSRFRFSDYVPSDGEFALTYKRDIQKRYRWLFEIFTEDAMEREQPGISSWNKILSLLESESTFDIIQERFANDTDLKQDKIDNHPIFEKVIDHLATDTEEYVSLIKDLFREKILEPRSNMDVDAINTLTTAVLEQSYFDLAEWMLENYPSLKEFLVTEDVLMNAIHENNSVAGHWLIDELRFMEGGISEEIILAAMKYSTGIFEFLEELGLVNWHEIVESEPDEFVRYWHRSGRPIDSFELRIKDIVNMIAGEDNITDVQVREIYDYVSPESYDKLHTALLRQGHYALFLDWMDRVPKTIPRLDVQKILDIVLNRYDIHSFIRHADKVAFIKHLLKENDAESNRIKQDQTILMSLLAFDSGLLDDIFDVKDAKTLLILKLQFSIKNGRYDHFLTLMQDWHSGHSDDEDDTNQFPSIVDENAKQFVANEGFLETMINKYKLHTTQNLLSAAVEMRYINPLEILLYNPLRSDDVDMEALFLQAVATNNTEIARIVMEEGVDVNAIADDLEKIVKHGTSMSKMLERRFKRSRRN